MTNLSSSSLVHSSLSEFSISSNTELDLPFATLFHILLQEGKSKQINMTSESYKSASEPTYDFTNNPFDISFYSIKVQN